LVLCDRPSGRFHRARLCACEVGADALPALPLVRALPDVLRRRVQRFRSTAREHDGERPLDAFLEVLRGPAHRVLRPYVDRAPLARRVVEAVERTAIAAGVENVGDLGVITDVTALASAWCVEELIRRGEVVPPR